MESPDFPDDFLAMGERPGPLNYIYLRCHRLHNLSSDFPIFYRLNWKHFGPKIHRFRHGGANRHFPCDQSGAAVCLCASAQHHGASCLQTHLDKNHSQSCRTQHLHFNNTRCLDPNLRVLPTACRACLGPQKYVHWKGIDRAVLGWLGGRFSLNIHDRSFGSFRLKANLCEHKMRKASQQGFVKIGLCRLVRHPHCVLVFDCLLGYVNDDSGASFVHICDHRIHSHRCATSLRKGPDYSDWR